MRLLQINPNGSDESALDFHPMVTVVQGLGRAGRELVVGIASGLPRGAAPSVGGLLEAHGVLLDLDAGSLDLLGMDADLDVVVSRQDVPGLGSASPTAVAPAASGPVRASREAIERFIAETPPGVHPELDQARQRRADGAEALGILREALEKSQAKYDPVLAEKRRLEASLEMARRSAIRYAEQREAVADAADAEAHLEHIETRRAELEEEVAELRSRVASIEQGLAELSSIDIRPLVVLLDAIRNPEPVEFMPSDRAHELADEFVVLTKRVAELERDLGAEGLDSGTAMRRLEECRVELAAAEKGMRKPELTDLDIAQLEAAHEEVVEAEKKATGLRKKAGEKAFEEARRKEQEILDRVGFPTWTAYVMGSSLMTIDHQAEQRLDAARADLEAAQEHWARVCEVIEANPEYRDLLNRLEEVYLEAHDLLSGADPDDLETALRELQVPKREVTSEELADALAYQLELVGLDLGPSPSIDLTVMAAEAFMEEAEAVKGRIDELREEEGQVAASLLVAEAELADLPPAPDAPVEEPINDALAQFLDGSDSPWVGDERSEAERTADAEVTGGGGDVLDAFLAPSSGSAEADEERIAQLEQELAAAEEEEAEYREWVESREALVDAALQVETVATGRLMKIAGELLGEGDDAPEAASPVEEPAEGPPDLATVERYVADRQDALLDVSFAGSVPLVIDDALTGLDATQLDEVLSRIDERADAVQVIYLTDDQSVADWAERVGFARAAVVQAPAGFGL